MTKLLLLWLLMMSGSSFAQTQHIGAYSASWQRDTGYSYLFLTADSFKIIYQLPIKGGRDFRFPIYTGVWKMADTNVIEFNDGSQITRGVVKMKNYPEGVALQQIQIQNTTFTKEPTPEQLMQFVEGNKRKEVAFTSSIANAVSACKVYSFNGNDSTHSALFAEFKYDEKKQVVYQSYLLGYRPYAIFPDYIGQAKIFYYYQDTFLTKKLSIYDGDSMVERFFYDESGRLHRNDQYVYSHYWAPDGHYSTIHEYKNGRKWKSQSQYVNNSGKHPDEIRTTFRFYDKKGRIALDSTSTQGFRPVDSLLGVYFSFSGLHYTYFANGYFASDLKLESLNSTTGDSVFYNKENLITRYVDASDGEVYVDRRQFYNADGTLSRVHTEYLDDPFSKTPVKKKTTFIFKYE